MMNLPWPLNSRKSITIAVAILVTLVLLATGQIDGDTAVAAITAQVVSLVLGIAGEDMAAKRGGGNVTVNAPQVEVDNSGGPV